MKNLFSIMSNLQTHYNFKLDFQRVNHIEEASGKSMAPTYVQSNIQMECPGAESFR